MESVGHNLLTEHTQHIMENGCKGMMLSILFLYLRTLSISTYCTYYPALVPIELGNIRYETRKGTYEGY